MKKHTKELYEVWKERDHEWKFRSPHGVVTMRTKRKAEAAARSWRRANRKVPKSLKDECGVTNISLDNARYMQARYGIPETVVFHTDGSDYRTEAAYRDTDIQEIVLMVYTGFGWGYSGEGPHGTLEFLNDMCNVDISISTIAGWDNKGSYRTIDILTEA